jgi:hypothetical protein
MRVRKADQWRGPSPRLSVVARGSSVLLRAHPTALVVCLDHAGAPTNPLCNTHSILSHISSLG